MSKPRYAPGEPIVVTWRNAPGIAGTGSASTGPRPTPRGRGSLLWSHTETAIDGKAVLDATNEGEGWPLLPGDYVACLLYDDSARVLGVGSLHASPPASEND